MCLLHGVVLHPVIRYGGDSVQVPHHVVEGVADERLKEHHLDAEPESGTTSGVNAIAFMYALTSTR